MIPQNKVNTQTTVMGNPITRYIYLTCVKLLKLELYCLDFMQINATLVQLHSYNNITDDPPFDSRYSQNGRYGTVT